MKNYKEKFIWWIISWLWITLVIWISWIAYWAYVAISDVAPNDTLTASTFNQVLSNIDSLKTSVDWLLSSNVPAWFVWAFNLASCPSGWIAADGTNGTPDLRGEFIRWLDNGRWVDSGRSLSSWQKPSLTIWDVLSHSMIVWFLWQWTSANRSEYWWENPLLSWYTSSFPNWGYEYIAATTVNYWGIDMATLWTVRPRNVALLYCVKQ